MTIKLSYQAKQDFADAAYKAIEHEEVQRLFREYVQVVGRALSNEEALVLLRTMQYVAIIARAEALGVDVTSLAATPDEVRKERERVQAEAKNATAPALILPRHHA